jgi:UDP-N-acetylglucosamine--N-acetylmuramyl-(pentapeptide) pyrophosphoryl-undecaprenol N-acetylglucosamine transferase
MEIRSILIAGGGTGGHVYPGLALASEIRRRRPELPVRFVGTATGLEARLVPAAGFAVDFIRSGGIAGKSWPRRILGALLIPVGLVQSARLILRSRAGLVIGVGGYSSGPVVLTARLLQRPTMVLEQNAVAGATNRILAPLVDRIAVSFAATAESLPGRVTVTGNPVREGFAALPDDRSPERLSLLVVGGSRGARGLNRAVVETLPRLAACSRPVFVHHQTGPADLEQVRETYDGSGVTARVEAYIEDMAAAYAAADLVICRAGATTIAELSATGRAAVLVPFPHATGAHQEANGRELVAHGAALMVRESEAGDGRLADIVTALLDDVERRTRMESQARSLGSPAAAGAVADLALELYDRRVKRVAAGNGRPS